VDIRLSNGVIVKMMLKKYNPAKNLKKRLPFWIAGLLVFIFLFKHEFIFALVWAIIFILIDERIKEGYWVKKSDFKKPLTHEFLIIITIIINIIIVFMKKIRRAQKIENNL